MKLSLLELAQAYDRVDVNNLDDRVEAALKVQEALGDRFGEFDELHSGLIDSQPDHPSAAETTLSRMGLA